MLRPALRVMAVLGSLFLLSGVAQATPHHSDHHKSDHRHGHGWKKADGHHWLRANFEHLSSWDWKRWDRDWDFSRWLNRSRSAGTEQGDLPGQRRWGSSGGTVTTSTADPTRGSEQPVPEPGAAIAFAAGLLVLARASRRRWQK